MDPQFPYGGLRWAERVLRLLSSQYRELFAVILAILATTVAAALSLKFAAGDDPLLRDVAKYATAALIISATVAVIVVIATALYLLVRSRLHGD